MISFWPLRTAVVAISVEPSSAEPLSTLPVSLSTTARSQSLDAGPARRAVTEPSAGAVTVRRETALPVSERVAQATRWAPATLTFAFVAGRSTGLAAYADEAVTEVTRRTTPRVTARGVKRMNALAVGVYFREGETPRGATSLFTGRA